MDALDILCAQLMRDLFAIAKFLFCQVAVQRTVRQTKTAVNGPWSAGASQSSVRQ